MSVAYSIMGRYCRGIAAVLDSLVAYLVGLGYYLSAADFVDMEVDQNLVAVLVRFHHGFIYFAIHSKGTRPEVGAVVRGEPLFCWEGRSPGLLFEAGLYLRGAFIRINMVLILHFCHLV